jgi:anaerobic selenocysteine-containing dehydrogenase
MGQDNERSVYYRTCPLCEATCGLEITLLGDQVVRIRGDKDDVFSEGFFCPKGAALGDLHFDPDRLQRPMVKRSGSFGEVSWDEAFAEAEKGLLPIIEQYGPDAVAVFFGNPCAHTLSGALYLRPFVKALGTKNLYSAGTTDQMPKHVSCGLMFGRPGAIPVPDLDRTDYLLMLGANPLVSGGSICTAPNFPGRIKAIQGRGGKVVVVDPVLTRTAKAASEHHYIRPGTDPYLLLAMTRTLFEEDLVDLGSLANHVNAVERIEEAARDFTADTASPVCGIDSEIIRRLARELAGAPSGAVYSRIGTHAAYFGTLNAWLVDVLNVLTGNLDRPGGAVFAQPAHFRPWTGPGGRGWTMGRWKSRVKGLPEVINEFPVATLPDEIETPGAGQVRSLVTVAGNPVVSAPNAARMDRALTSLDFMVSVDFYLNETTRHANVILPPPGPLAVSHYDFFLNNFAVCNIANYSPPILRTEEGHPGKWEILLKLSMIVSGQGNKADHNALDAAILRQNVEGLVKDTQSPIHGRDPDDIMAELSARRGPDRMLDLMLRTGVYGDGFGRNPDGLSLNKLEAYPHGLEFGPIRPAVPEILRTVSGTIELAPEAILADLERLKKGKVKKEAELVMIGRRHIRSCNSWMHNIETLVQGPDRCTLLVHPDDAARLGLSEGGRARVTSRVGSVEAPVEISADILPGVVSMPHGWGHDVPGVRMSVAQAHPGVNSNLLADEELLDPVSGNAVLNGIPVTVEAAD